MGKYDCPPDEEEEEYEPVQQKTYQEHWEFMEKFADQIISDTPQTLYKNAISYAKWCQDNPITSKRKQLTGKNAGSDIVIEYPRPLTIKGLCLHCNIDEEYIMDIRNMKDKENPYYVAMIKVLYMIYTQNAEGAMVGIYESGFTAKMLNIEKEEMPTGVVKVEHINELPELLDSENAILEKLDLENPEWKKLRDQDID
jgi:hypothetical protein